MDLRDCGHSCGQSYARRAEVEVLGVFAASTSLLSAPPDVKDVRGRVVDGEMDKDSRLERNMTDEDTTLVECPKCFGTGRNRRGGPCRHCKATGAVEHEED